MTEKKHGKGLPNDSENIYKTIFDSCIDAIFITSTDGGIQSANAAACRMFGYTEEELKKAGRNGILDLTDERIPALLAERERSGSISGELRYKRKDNSVFPADFTSTVFKDSSGGTRTITIIRDVSEFKATFEKLNRTIEEYINVFDNSLMGISMAKPGSGFIRINKAYAELYGYPDIESMLKEVSENTIKLYANPEDRQKVLSLLETKGYMPPTEFELIKRNGEKFWALVSAKPVKDNSGKIMYLQADHIDITNNKRVESELRKSKDSLEKLNRHMNDVIENERSQIALNLHDDLGQKLTALNMDLSWLKTRIGVQSKVVEKKFQQMQLLMNDTIDSIQKISFGLRPSILDDLGLQSAIVWQLKEFSKSSGIGVKSFFSPRDLVIDNQISLAIFRIVQEALTNILRHSGATDAEIKIKAAKKVLQVLIKDNGKGIEQDQIENKKSYGLIGMRERVKAIGGEIKITGNKGTGTEIFVKITLKD